MPTLHWLTREADLGAAGRAPYRLLEEVPELGHGDPAAGNMLIQGDNLEALKALLPFYAGRVKCIYIDPPYNTRSAFEHYDDNLEHTQWLAMMWPRLELLRELLAEDGSIWVSIDDNEGHYLKVIMDEVFGRNNFIANVVWQKKYTIANDAIWLSDNHDHILVYAKDSRTWRPNKLRRTELSNQGYKNPDDDPRGPWMSDNYTCNKNADERPNLYYPITNPNTGEEIWPKRTAVWRYNPDAHRQNVESNKVYWGASGKNSVPRFKRFLSGLRSEGRVSETIWLYEHVGHTQDAKRECMAFNPDDPFSTPKPEKLLGRILELSTNPGDLLIDSFLGSGTSAAVAIKMGRRVIGVEMGDHAVTHCAPRLRKVVDGEQGGISKAEGWTGGSGFRFYRLGPPVFDADGRITPDISFAALAAHVWFSETGKALPAGAGASGPVLGVEGERAIALLYNGVLGDRRPESGNVLTRPVLRLLRDALPGHAGPWTIYGERSALTPASLEREAITFRQTPYDVKARR